MREKEKEKEREKKKSEGERKKRQHMVADQLVNYHRLFPFFGVSEIFLSARVRIQDAQQVARGPLSGITQPKLYLERYSDRMKLVPSRESRRDGGEKRSVNS